MNPKPTIGTAQLKKCFRSCAAVGFGIASPRGTARPRLDDELVDSSRRRRTKATNDPRVAKQRAHCSLDRNMYLTIRSSRVSVCR